MDHKAIVFNCHYNGLSIIQELGLHGIKCVAMDSVRSIGTFSKYAQYVRCPDPAEAESEFVDMLYEFCKKEEQKPVLFPTNDTWACAISRYRDRLSEVSLPCVSDKNVVELLIDKTRFYHLGASKNWLTPKTWDFLTLQDALQNNEIAFPIVAKPRARRFSSNRSRKTLHKQLDALRLVLLQDQDELEKFLYENEGIRDYVIFQEFIHGNSASMYTVGIYADKNNEILGMFTGKKVRGYPPQEGDCIIGENHSVPDYVIQNTERIVKEIGYHGIAEFEYMHDEKTGEFRLIEVNPRSWSWIGITPACGVSLPMIAYSDLVDVKTKQAISSYPDSTIAYLKVLEDLTNCIFRYKKTYPKWQKTYKEWRKELSSYKTVVFAEFNAKDYLVSLMAVVYFVRNIVRSVVKMLIQKAKKQ